MRLILLLFLTTVLWGQKGSLSAGFGEFEVWFLSRVEPQGEDADAHLPGAILVERAIGRVHHMISDRVNKREFGYDLTLEPGKDGTVQLRIEPMKFANGRPYPVEPGWTLLELPKYPVIPRVKVGDTVALDLLVNPATGQKIVDYLTVLRRTETPVHDFTLDDIGLVIVNPTVKVNGAVVLRSRHGAAGRVVWVYLAGHGRFILSLFPNEKLGFRKNGVVANDAFTFRAGSTEYRIECGRAVAPGTGRYNLYVVHEPAWQPGGQEPFTVGSADNPEWVVGKH